MNILKKTIVASAALSLVALGSIPAFVTAEAAETAGAAPYLQVIETADNTLYNFGKNETADYTVSVRAMIGKKERIHEIVVRPSWAYGDTPIELSDIDLGSWNADVKLTDDRKAVHITNMVDRQVVTFKIKRDPQFDDPQTETDSLVNEVRASGVDAHGNAINGKVPQSENTCQPNARHFQDTDACATASIPVPHFRVNLIPSVQGKKPGVQVIQTQARLENFSSADAAIVFHKTRGIKIQGYKFEGGDYTQLDETTGDTIRLPLGQMNKGVVKNVFFYGKFVNTEDGIKYGVTSDLNGFEGDYKTCKVNYGIASDADGCDYIDWPATSLGDKAPMLEGKAGSEINPKFFHVTVGADQLTEVPSPKGYYDKYDNNVEGKDDAGYNKKDFTCTAEDSLPAGLTVRKGVDGTKCVIEGTPTEGGKGTYSVNVKFADSANYALSGNYNFEKSDADKVVDAYRAKPSKATYDAALKATENHPVERAHLEEAKKNIDSPSKDKDTETAPATEDKPEIKLPKVTKVPDTAPVAEDKPVGVVPEKKHPGVAFGPTYIDHSKSSNPGTSNKDEAASENDKSTGAAASENDKSTGAAASENDKSTGAAADSQKSATENEPELARTGVTAVRTLAGIAALLALCGVVALRTSRKA